MSSDLLSEQRAGIDLVRLNRPERRNAMVPQLMLDLAAKLRQVGRPPGSIKGLVLTGEGVAFCVGADLKWIASEKDPGNAVATLAAAHHAAVWALRQIAAPTIAAVNGAAAGGGMSLALAADFRIASPNATFTAAYFRLGLTPDGGNSAFLVRNLGAARAMELLLTSRTLSAQEALSLGLVNEIVETERLLDRACELAVELSAIPGQALLAARRLLDAGATQPLREVLDLEQAAISEAARSPAFREALARFLTRPR